MSARFGCRALVAALAILLLVGSSRAQTTTTYSYDALGRLTGATTSSGDVETYSYDAAGNRTASVNLGVGNVVLLVGADGTDGSTVIIDESYAGRTLAAAGGAQIDTTASKQGTASILFDGVNDVVRAIDSNDFDLGSGRFTLEAWIKPSDLTGTRFLMGQWQAYGDLGWIMYQNGSALALNVSTTGFDNITHLNGGALTTSAFQHVAIDFDGTKYRAYIGGALVASTTTVRTFKNSPNAFSIGANHSGNGFHFAGWMDEIRVIKGIALYAADGGFAPPTAPLQRPVPRFSVDPFISGTAAIGATLTGSPGTHNGVSATYRWANNGVAIPGATGLTYVVDASDAGDALTFEVTAVNFSSSSTATSAPMTGGVADHRHRYWRIRSSDTAVAGEFFGITELQMRSVSAGADLTTGMAAATSAYYPSYEPSKAINNNPADFWTTGATGAPSGGHWLSVDFTSSVTIREVVIQVRPDGYREDPLNLFVEWSDDHMVWTTDWSVAAIAAWSANETRTFTKP